MKIHANNNLLGKKDFLRKKDLLFRIMVDNSTDYNSAEEALSILIEMIGDVDLTVASLDITNVHIIATTIANPDNLLLLKKEVKYRMLSDVGFSKASISLRSRPDLIETRVIPLIIGNTLHGYLFVDVYGENILDSCDLTELFEILTVIIRLCNLEHNKKFALKADNLTRLLTRDSLVQDIKDIIENGLSDEVHLAVIYISNASVLNSKLGIEQVDGILVKIAKELMKENETNVYRIGGMKFALLTHKNLQDACLYMQTTIDNLREIEKDITFSIIIVPILEDAYKTVYLCEKHIKVIESDVVTVFRGEPSDAESEEFLQAVNTLIPKADEVKYVEEARLNESVFQVDLPEDPCDISYEIKEEVVDGESTVSNDFSFTEDTNDYSSLVL